MFTNISNKATQLAQAVRDYGSSVKTKTVEIIESTEPEIPLGLPGEYLHGDKNWKAIPTKLSQLQNDVPYVTQAEVSAGGSAARLTTPRSINNAAFDGTADIIADPRIDVNSAGAALQYVMFVPNAQAAFQRPYVSANLTYNPSTNTLTVRSATATKLHTARKINNTLFDGSADIRTSEYIHSQRTFAQGTLIETDIDYSVTDGEAWVLELKGNAYAGGLPFEIQAQGRIFSGSMVQLSGYTVGSSVTGLVAFNQAGKLCFWCQPGSAYQGFNAKVYVADTTGNQNRITAITDVTKPAGVTKEVSLTLTQVLHDANFNNYAPTKTGGGASGSWGINAATATKLQTARTLAATGDISWNSGAFDGSANVSAAAALSTTGVTAGSYGSATSIATFTVDAKGRISAAASVVPSGTWGISITGNAATVTNGIYSSGSYADPAWLTSLSAAKLTGAIDNARLSGTYTGFSYKFDGDVLPLRSPSAGSPSAAARTALMPAEFKSAGSATTGAIVFIAPNVTSTIMYQFGLVGMLYNNSVFDLTVQGYRTTGAWSALRKISKGTADVRVRLGVTPDGKNCLILGDIDTVWAYPHVVMKYLMISHTGGNSDANVTGWTTDLVTDLSTYTNVTADLTTNAQASDIGGNAATATALQTPRDINGTAFDGSAAITTLNWGTARTITIGGTGKSVNGGANVSWTLAEIGAPSLTGSGASGTWGISITGNAATATSATSASSATSATNASNVAVTNDETTNATHYPLFASATSGNNAIKAASNKLTFNPSTGLFWASDVGSGSDERFKHSWESLPSDFLQKLASVKHGTFLRTDNEGDAVNERYVGVSAQSLEPALPEAVKVKGDGSLGVSYGSAALVSVIALTQEVLTLRERIKALEEKLNGSAI